MTESKKQPWRQYEEQVYAEFCANYADAEISFDQHLPGRFSEALRQVDVVVRSTMAGDPVLGVFDCKCFQRQVDVTEVDRMIGFMDDLNANLAGIVTTVGFSDAAVRRAKASRVTLRTIKFESVAQLVAEFVPSLDFSDPRNSMYLGAL